MINYQSHNPTKNFIMIDKEIDIDLSADAFYLLIKLMKLAPNESNSTIELREKTKFSKRRFERVKAELISKEYLETKQLFGNVYAFYIGKQIVQIYKNKYKRKNSRYDQNQIKKV